MTFYHFEYLGDTCIYLYKPIFAPSFKQLFKVMSHSTFSVNFWEQYDLVPHEADRETI